MCVGGPVGMPPKHSAQGSMDPTPNLWTPTVGRLEPAQGWREVKQGLYSCSHRNVYSQPKRSAVEERKEGPWKLPVALSSCPTAGIPVLRVALVHVLPLTTNWDPAGREVLKLLQVPLPGYVCSLVP